MQVIPFAGLSLYQMFLMFCFWSFIGWCIEVIDMTYETGENQNRGFLNMPICPIEGLGVVMVTVFFRPIANTIVPLFVASTILCTAFELFVGWGMEKLFHARWWDYSHYRFNIQGRICLLGAIVFGFGGVLIIDVVQPQVERLTAMIPLLAVHVICAVAAIVVIIDTIVICSCSAFIMLLAPADLINGLEGMDLLQAAWQWGKEEFREKMHDLSESSQERVANMRQLVSSALNWQQRRMIRSFPRMRSTDSTKYSKIMETVREMLRRK